MRVWMGRVGHIGTEDSAGGGGIADNEDVARPRATMGEFFAVVIEGAKGGAVSVEAVGEAPIFHELEACGDEKPDLFS